ncbi:LPS assembly protein LptD [uncultured Litoreibacter sp.]|uniref:LPS-assembly protein LptD n=1 Tax=uncultured Litoreibacter sp. TaxID=1392394 RepID=UPI0026063394|nr:LPS assembly protein LptD [uncultured Litoreibacter sp.]
MRALILALIVSLALPGLALAQSQPQTASLVADEVTFDPQGRRLLASGNVEVLQDGIRLRASSIAYDGATDRLVVTGPLYLIDGQDVVIVAEFAELSGDLQDGILAQARVVFAQQLQLAANEVRRSGGRYTQFYKTVASSCQICADNPTPLWEIRAKRITHDGQERQLYFENASFRVLDVPVFYWPYLRLPDPTVQRASGFLLPSLNSDGDLGVGIKIPYFFTLGDHADLTLTPWLTWNGSKTLEARYRQKLSFGEFEINGAITEDNLTTTENIRGYVFADGTFALPRGFTLKFDVEAVTDNGYLLQYDYSDKDRLDSAIDVFRASRDEYIGLEVVHYKSLRDGDNNRTLPTLVGDAIYKRRFDPGSIGGIASFQLEASGHYRRSDFPVGPLSRDVARLSAAADWRRDWVMGNGMIFAAATELRADWYQIRQGGVVTNNDTTEITHYAMAEWRWPMLRQSAGASHLLEPVVQLVWAKDGARSVDNEDSVLVEFDEANLFSFSRFPGVDGQERGRRINLGVTYTREDVDGWGLGVTVGRVIRESDLGQFSVSTGLQGKSSDWLIAAQLKVGEQFDVINRVVFDDSFSISRNEMRLNWTGDTYRLGSTFAWLEADAAEGRPIDTSEFAVDGAYRVSRHWTLSSNLRYDFVGDRTTRAGIGASYQNECAKVDLSLSRRFTSSTNVTPTTDFNLSVQLAGFGARGIGGESFARKCNG